MTNESEPGMQRVHSTTLQVINRVGPETPAGKHLREQLDVALSQYGSSSDEFEAAVNYLYGSSTHIRGLKDLYIEELTMLEWYGELNAMAEALREHLDPGLLD